MVNGQRLFRLEDSQIKATGYYMFGYVEVQYKDKLDGEIFSSSIHDTVEQAKQYVKDHWGISVKEAHS